MAHLEQVTDTLVKLSGEFHESDVLYLRARLEGLVGNQRSGEFEIHLDEVSSVSSALLSLFLCCARRAESVGCELKLTGIPQKLYDMARVGGLEAILPLSDLGAPHS